MGSALGARHLAAGTWPGSPWISRLISAGSTTFWLNFSFQMIALTAFMHMNNGKLEILNPVQTRVLILH